MRRVYVLCGAGGLCDSKGCCNLSQTLFKDSQSAGSLTDEVWPFKAIFLAHTAHVAQLGHGAEHVASECLSRALAQIADAIPGSEGPACILACAEGEEHTLGLSLAELCLREAGWSTIWAGRRTPLVDIVTAVESGSCGMVALSASTLTSDARALAKQAERMAAACSGADIPLALGGSGAWPSELAGSQCFVSFEPFHDRKLESDPIGVSVAGAEQQSRSEVTMPEHLVLLTGATGFVGSAVRPALAANGWRVKCLTRNEAEARRRQPSLEWVQGDVGEPDSCAAALSGCEAAFYLVHGIGEGADYHEREVRSASTFAKAAARAGVERIVYLGGVAPVGTGSDHLRSRLDVGEALRAGSVKTIELRASMIVGHGSLSWLIVRDLAARLPVMVLPRWLRSRTQPVAIDDVVIALVRALELPVAASACFDIPGPDALSGKAILEETARVMGLPQPHMVGVPLLSPHLSSLWVRFVTRAEWSVAREVVVGLTEDLLAHDDRFWQLVGHPRRLRFGEAARLALDAERRGGRIQGTWGAVERARGLTTSSA